MLHVYNVMKTYSKFLHEVVFIGYMRSICGLSKGEKLGRKVISEKGGNLFGRKLITNGDVFGYVLGAAAEVPYIKL